MLPEGLCDIPKNDCEAETTLKTTGDIVFLSSAFASLEFPYNISMARVHVTAFTLANLVFNKFFSDKSPSSKTGMLAFGPQELSRKSLSLPLEKGKTKKIRHICWRNLSGYSVLSYFSFKKHNPTR